MNDEVFVGFLFVMLCVVYVGGRYFICNFNIETIDEKNVVFKKFRSSGMEIT